MQADSAKRKLNRERRRLLAQIERWFELPLVILAFVWLILLVLDFVRGLSPLLNHLTLFIWVVFIADFVLRFTLAPRKLAYLRRNWLTAIALAVPALRVFRIVRALRILRLARAGRSLQLVRVLSSINRGMRALAKTMSRRGFGYVTALTAIVLMTGAAGMYAFERSAGGLNSYGEALWWTAMLLTTMGSSYWPQTVEGRALCFLLSLYALGVLGYVTAALASYFIGRDAENEGAEIAGERSILALRADINDLRQQLERSRQAEKSAPAAQ
jgi:voltage-gated potassium channel